MFDKRNNSLDENAAIVYVNRWHSFQISGNVENYWEIAGCVVAGSVAGFYETSYVVILYLFCVPFWNFPLLICQISIYLFFFHYFCFFFLYIFIFSPRQRFVLCCFFKFSLVRWWLNLQYLGDFHVFTSSVFFNVLNLHYLSDFFVFFLTALGDF